MSHMIETMAYSGATPWHKLGTLISERITAMAALAVAGLDWTVDLRPAFAFLAGQGPLPIPGANAVVRVNADGSDRDTIGVVGDKYAPIQNTALAEWCDALSAASEGRAYVEALGSLDGGRRVWVLMKHNGDSGIQLAGDDSRIDKYLLCCSSHDGSLQMQMRLTGVRVVCQNTLSMALREGTRASDAAGWTADNVISIRHTSGAQARMDAAIKAVGQVDDYFQGFTALADKLTRTPMTRDSYASIVEALTPVKLDSNGKVPTVTQNKRDTMMSLLDSTPGAQPGTAWGAYNALVDYADHHSAIRGAGDNVAERRAEQQLTTATTFKDTALDLICAATSECWGSLQLASIVDNTEARQHGNSALLADIVAATVQQ